MQTLAEKRGQEWLARGGLRPTRQRLTLATLLVGGGGNRHVTAEGLYAEARQVGEAVSLATVYNTMRAFCQAGLMQEITVDATRSFFDTRMDEHPHYFWEETSEITDAPVEDLVISRLPAAPEGTEMTRVDVVLRVRRIA
ncbi:Fur family transcriptional regulator Irr [Phaeovulum sp.]|jgi:Fur family iron response transcriptional regulator|uniref:Fur family transcriptional regulator Irr n=1 Tax=Phaeovulum sp. TaxID=2934796 RepID=UPI002730CD2F|nr:transcriptional repressor [Phaeovulum sp.]MDP1669993.1 transcriptional repressor [Phaeovulum sp.]MDP2061962.1 transcriptional repressor [Phaeovulum sp.]MDP3862294.1 transcriptional repressor [Phaeovulum sp.]MDZ4118705.1 transcriptional repressor [Phaeovulum sp.]